MKILRKIVFAMAILWPVSGLAQETPQQAAETYVQAHQKEIIEEFLALLSMPNVAANLEDIYVNAEYIQGLLERRGFATELLTTGEDSRPAIYGELMTPGAAKTVMLYIHYDGQPVDESR